MNNILFHLRKANLNDLPRITEIYNEAILNTSATFDTALKSVENRKQWFEDRDENFPILVAVKEEIVIGYGALNKWSERQAYAITAEISLYIHADYRGHGIGKSLIKELITVAKNQTNLNSLIARITQGNEQSIYLHQLHNFELMGVMKQAGRKFDKLHDVTFLQLMLR